MHFLSTHRAYSQDSAGLRFRPLPEGIEGNSRPLRTASVRRIGLDVRGVLPVRAGDADGDERQDKFSLPLTWNLALPSQRRQKNPCLRASITDERAEWSYMKEVLASSDPARML